MTTEVLRLRLRMTTGVLRLRLRMTLLVALPDRERDKAQREADESGDIPSQVLGQAVVQYPEPSEHLSEQPAVQAVGNAGRRAPALRPPAVVEAQVDHLDERVQPRQEADTAQLRDQQ